MGSISHLFAILLSSLATCASPLPGSGLLGGVSSTLSPVTGTVTNVVSGSSAQPGVINALTPVTNTLGSGPVGVVVGSVPALLESQCDSAFSKCNVTVSGKIENMLTDGGDFSKFAVQPVGTWKMEITVRNLRYSLQLEELLSLVGSEMVMLTERLSWRALHHCHSISIAIRLRMCAWGR